MWVGWFRRLCMVMGLLFRVRDKLYFFVSVGGWVSDWGVGEFDVWWWICDEFYWYYGV